MVGALEFVGQSVLSVIYGIALAFFLFTAYACGRLLADHYRDHGRRAERVGLIGVTIAASLYATGLGTRQEGYSDDSEVVRVWWPTPQQYGDAFGRAIGLLGPCLLFGIAEGRDLQRMKREREAFWERAVKRLMRRRKKRVGNPDKPPPEPDA